ncbi:pyridoxal phosphate-dependent aminotransferase family protein [Aquimarina sp. MMG016]|uniref:aminotransferase class I/II-fold pyridoxal phosphate-dependent enzyme n=1 Tax=Aquimarina sp. MMG016 TaxID=2822690 RepID=UPI001B3A1F1A|nr:pyridoxal phosphate-dependent aminotransferase family protein [Aquimarina sp. MMG016]MBQ4819816.1 pyridoxal phosphate-dependent aminotransferase family protein [Aquimarina sp. MMG016]
MEGLPKKLQKKLLDREESNALRKLPKQTDLVDFSSNDYLGFAVEKKLFDKAHQILVEKEIHQNGATGSRLLSGNHQLYIETEAMLTKFHNAESALIFNSGYDANIGFFSSVPQRGDIIFYDEFIHASIRDGIQMSNAKSYKFAHNDIEELKTKLLSLRSESKSQQEVFVVTESVFSMDGDSPDLKTFVDFCNEYKCYLIVDEAHATGVFGDKGVGLLQELRLEDEVFARINTFGKALGSHGAVIFGSKDLKSYLVNFARSFIYTTGLPPHTLATIQSMYTELKTTSEIEKLQGNIQFFKQKLKTVNLKPLFIDSNSAIHCCVIRGNENVKSIAAEIKNKDFDVKPILSPTVPLGKERLRFCLHSYNSDEEIAEVLELLATFVSK